MGNLSCQNYYCQDISFKPEWFSENSWNIEYKYSNLHNDSNEIIQLPYYINKGILKINEAKEFRLIISKKLLINFYVSKYITIPFNFNYNILSNSTNSTKINIYLIFSTDNISINYNPINNAIKNDLPKLFFINIILEKNKMLLKNSFSENTIKKKIKPDTINNITFDLENTINFLYIKQHMISHDIDEKYFIDNIFDENESIYLSILIESNKDLNKSEFLNISFD